MSEIPQISSAETRALLDELKRASQFAGDVVEFGCYTGDTSVLLAAAIQNQPDKWLWLYDSFAGLPPKTAADQSSTGQEFRTGALRANPDTVRRKFRQQRLPDPVIKQAWFEDLDPDNDLPSKICFALLDGDFYTSIRTSLALVAPKLVTNGIIVVHDYRNPALPGSAKAVNEFLANQPEFGLRVLAGMAIIERKSASAEKSPANVPDNTRN